MLKLSALSTAVMAAMFWALWLWSKRSPLPPAIAGLTIYVTMWWVTTAYSWAALTRLIGYDAAMRADPLSVMTLLRWLITIGLLRAVISGAKHRRLQQRLLAAPISDNPALPLADTPRRIAGLGTSIALFAVMLYIILDLIALWGTGELTPALLKKMVMVNAIIIITWSIACWRDVYRPLARPINPLWYFGAIGLGGCTFAISTGWVALVRLWANLPSPDVAALSQGQSWVWQLLLIAVAPAIVEELAFRGVIFGAFLRSLKGWETVIVTALMFMVLHADIPAFPHLLLIGVVLGVLRLRSGSWLPGVFLHFTHNFLVLLSASR